MLTAQDLVKSYDGRTVVDRVSLSIDAGEIVGLLGRNGAGKTTTFRMVIGMITPEAGRLGVRFQPFAIRHCLSGRVLTNTTTYGQARWEPGS